MNPTQTHTTADTDALIKRYKDAYTVAKVVVSFGAALKVLGFLFGVGFFALGFGLTENFRGIPDSIKTIYIGVGAGIGIIVWLIFYALGVLTSCHGQVLRASLDEAVFACPFFTDTNRIIAASLPTNRSAS